MGRRRQGSAFEYPKGSKRYVVQLWINGKRSKRIALSEGTSEAKAQETARAWQEAADEGRMLPTVVEAPDPRPEGETVESYSDRWLAMRRDPKEARAHLRLHILPTIGALPVVAVTPKDLRAVVAYLDTRVKAGDMAWKTAVNVFGTLTKMFGDAVNAKQDDLRILDSKPDPAEHVLGPDRGDERQGPFLYPVEADALFACEDVPPRWRLVYAFAFFTGLRSGELAVLRVSDVDLVGGFVKVHKARDRRKAGTEKGTKGKRARRVPIELALRPMLVALTEGRAGTDLLLNVPPKQKIAEKLRQHLRRAGLHRDELHADDAQRRPLAFHDARHTYAVWLALTGKGELSIQRRLGHATTEETQGYINEAEILSDVGQPFGTLPVSLVAAASDSATAKSSDGWKVQQYQRGGRDSNAPHHGNTAFSPGYSAVSGDLNGAKSSFAGKRERFGSASDDDAEAVGRFVLGELAGGLAALRNDPLDAYSYGFDDDGEGGADG